MGKGKPHPSPMPKKSIVNISPKGKITTARISGHPSTAEKIGVVSRATRAKFGEIRRSLAGKRGR